MTALQYLVSTIAIYWAAKWVYRRCPRACLSPIITAPAIIIAFLLANNISYSAYYGGAVWLSKFLQPATVAFAFPLYKYRQILRKHALEIVAGVATGSAIAGFSSLLLGKGFSLNNELINSLVPHSITTPIAIEVAKHTGGIPPIAAVLVVITGILGTIIGPFVIDLLKIENEIARGVLFGTSAHAAGTAKAFELSNTTGTISSLAMIISAIISACAIPSLLSYIN